MKHQFKRFNDPCTEAFAGWVRDQMDDLECSISTLSKIARISRNTISYLLSRKKGMSKKNEDKTFNAICLIRMVTEMDEETFKKWLNRNLQQRMWSADTMSRLIKSHNRRVNALGIKQAILRLFSLYKIEKGMLYPPLLTSLDCEVCGKAKDCLRRVAVKMLPAFCEAISCEEAARDKAMVWWN